MHSDAINAFVVKLNLWGQRAKNNNFASFHHLTEITVDDFNKNLKEDIISHLGNLQDEFERYFSEINTGSILMKVARNPFIHKVEDVPEAIQEEFTELTNDSFAKDEFHSCKLEEFWVKMQHCYPVSKDRYSSSEYSGSVFFNVLMRMRLLCTAYYEI